MLQVYTSCVVTVGTMGCHRYAIRHRTIRSGCTECSPKQPQQRMPPVGDDGDGAGMRWQACCQGHDQRMRQLHATLFSNNQLGPGAWTSHNHNA